MTTEIDSSTPGCEIVSTRIVNASRELVYRSWTEPGYLKNWWGPHGFTNTFNEFDLRVGGKWCFVMHGPDKGNYANECEFTAIDRPSLLAWKRHSKPLFRVVVSFEEVAANRTRVVFRQVFDTKEECKKIKAFALDKNEENFDRLENELRLMAAESKHTNPD